MKVLFIAPSTQLSLHFLSGWGRAFRSLGFGFKHLDPAREEPNGLLREHGADLILTAAGEGLTHLDLDLVNEIGAKVIYAALPYNSAGASFDPQTPLAPPKEMELLAKLKNRVAWTQHEPHLHPYFYKGYQDREIPLIYLPYCADLTAQTPLAEPAFPTKDLFFIGNLAHRTKGNLEILSQLLGRLTPERVEIHGDQEWHKRFGIQTQPLSHQVPWGPLYQNAAICPNLHNWHQKTRLLQVNDRTFHIALYGGFQLTDNPLAAKFFGPEELAVAPSAQDFVDQFFYYLEQPSLRQEMIKKARARIAKEHTYFNRIAALFAALEVDQPVVWQGQTFGATDFAPGFEYPWSLGSKLKATLETDFYLVGRGIKRGIKKIMAKRAPQP